MKKGNFPPENSSHVDTGQAHVSSVSNSVQSNSSKGQSSQMEMRPTTKADDLRTLNKPRTPTVEWNKSNKVSNCPPPVKTPGAASTPALGTVTKTRISFVTTPIETRAHETTPKLQNYSVIPEDDPLLWNQSFGFDEALISCSEELLMRSPEASKLENTPVKPDDVKASKFNKGNAMTTPMLHSNNNSNTLINKNFACTKPLHLDPHKNHSSGFPNQPENIKRRRIEGHTVR